MYSRVIIYPYNMKSESARALKDAIDDVFEPILVYPDKNYVRKPKHLVINWGSSIEPKWHKDTNIINEPNSVGAAINKLTTFQRLEGTQVGIPLFTTDPARAVEWLRQGTDLIARTKLDSSEGHGAHFIEAPTQGTVLKHLDVGFENEGKIRMWTTYMPKAREFRIHVFNRRVIQIQEKKRRLETPDTQVDWKIRSHSKGWVFAFNDLEPVPPPVLDTALHAVRNLELDFGAADIVWNHEKQRATFLEINTAPGLEGETIQSYAQAIVTLARAG